jgi:hypothetical protein
MKMPMLMLANQFRVASELGTEAKLNVPDVTAEYLTISKILQRVPRAKSNWPFTFKIRYLENGDAIILAFLNLDIHPCRKSASSLGFSCTTKRVSDGSTGDRIRKSRDHQDHLPRQEAAFTRLDRKPLIADFLAGTRRFRVTKKYGLSALSI